MTRYEALRLAAKCVVLSASVSYSQNELDSFDIAIDALQELFYEMHYCCPDELSGKEGGSK